MCNYILVMSDHVMSEPFSKLLTVTLILNIYCQFTFTCQYKYTSTYSSDTPDISFQANIPTFQLTSLTANDKTCHMLYSPSRAFHSTYPGTWYPCIHISRSTPRPHTKIALVCNTTTDKYVCFTERACIILVVIRG